MIDRNVGVGEVQDQKPEAQYRQRYGQRADIVHASHAVVRALIHKLLLALLFPCPFPNHHRSAALPSAKRYRMRYRETMLENLLCQSVLLVVTTPPAQ